jgi:hypothetical protein
MADPGLNPADLETYNPEYCEKLRVGGENSARSGVGLDIFPGLKDKASFEKTISDALKEYPNANESIVRQYLTCLAEGYYGSGKVPFDTSSDASSNTWLWLLGAAAVVGTAIWWKKGRK